MSEASRCICKETYVERATALWPTTGMTRRTGLAWMGAVAAASLPACGGAGNQPAQQAATSKAPASIIYSTTWDQERQDVLNRGMAIFRQKFSHIKVEVLPGQAN